MTGSGECSLSAVYYTVLNGATGTHTTPVLVNRPTKQHQVYPDIAVNAGTAHVLWWDSRNDSSCATPVACAQQPIGNTADRHVVPDALDTYATSFPTATGPTGGAVRMSDVSTNPNYEQFDGRTVPFAGEYLWIDSVGTLTYGTWTDWRNTVPGTDQRETSEGGAAEPNEGADVKQCRHLVAPDTWSGDTCPGAGGLDQDIYGDLAPEVRSESRSRSRGSPIGRPREPAVVSHGPGTTSPAVSGQTDPPRTRTARQALGAGLCNTRSPPPDVMDTAQPPVND